MDMKAGKGKIPQEGVKAQSFQWSWCGGHGAKLFKGLWGPYPERFHFLLQGERI